MRVIGVDAVGLGAPGAAVAARLLERGCEVWVHDHDPWAVAAAVRRGASSARTPADTADSADLVVLLPDEAATGEVLVDCGGVGETLRRGGAVVHRLADDVRVLPLGGRRAAHPPGSPVEAWFPAGTGGPPAPGLVGCAPHDLPAVVPPWEAADGDDLRTGPVGFGPALRGVAAGLAATPPTTSEGDVRDGPVLDRRTVPQVLGHSSRGAAGEGDPSRRPDPGVPALAEAVADVWLAVRGAARDGVELTSVERTLAAPFPARADGDPDPPERRRSSSEDPVASGSAPSGAEPDPLPEPAEALTAVSGHHRPSRGSVNCLALEPGDSRP